MNFFFKALLIWICVFYASGCKDNSLIAGDYYYSDLGTINSMIIRAHSNSPNVIVVDSRVDAVIVVGNNIYVARRPTIYFKEDETMRVKLTSGCEFYAINTQDDSVTLIDKIPEKSGELTCLP